MEWTIEGICDCSPQDTSEVQAIKGLPEGYDPRFSIDVNKLLVEGKGIGKVATDITRDVVLAHATTKGASFHKGKSKARSAARKQLERVLNDTHVRLMSLVDRFKKKKKYVRFDAFKKDFKSILKSAYYKAYELGLKSTGSAIFLTAGGSKLITPSDKKWVESAFLQEMKYLNGFLTDIKLNRIPGRWPHRVGMYVATVGSIYYTGRVAVTPPNHALFWIAKIDNKLCPQCRYMATHSPFSKFNIPIKHSS